MVLNLIDGGDLDFVRAQLATYSETFAHLGLIAAPGGLDSERPRNVILIASHEPLATLEVSAADGEVVAPDRLRQLVDRGLVLDDDYAPVDQLRRAR